VPVGARVRVRVQVRVHALCAQGLLNTGACAPIAQTHASSSGGSHQRQALERAACKPHPFHIGQ